MIWGIFKKDLRLFWPFLAGLVAMRAIDFGLVFSIGLPTTPLGTGELRQFFGLIETAVIALVTVLAVQQDSIASDAQDWLARPFRRSDMLLAKLLLVFAAIVAPQFPFSLLLALLQQHPFGEALPIALAGTVVDFVHTLPVIVIAALARTLLEAALGLLLLAALTYPAFMILPFLEDSSQPLVLLRWIYLLVQISASIVIAALILVPQYKTRRTVALRGALVGLVLGYFAIQYFWPWNAAYAMQEAVSPNPAFAAATTIAFDPTLARFAPNARRRFGPVKPTFFLPLRISGLPDSAMLTADRFILTVTDASGTRLYQRAISGGMEQGQANEDGSSALRLRLPDAAHGVIALHQGFRLPRTLYGRIKDQPVHVRVDYFLSTFARGAALRFAALGDRKYLPGFGLCMSRGVGIGSMPSQIMVSCFKSPTTPHCFVQALRNRKTGQQNPDQDGCYDYYSPGVLRLPELADNASDQLTMVFLGADFDLQGKPLPVQYDQLPDTDIVITPYAPQAWMTRSVETPLIRLRDFEGLPSASVVSRRSVMRAG